MFGGSNQVFGCLGFGCHHGVVVVSCRFFSGDEAARSQDTSEREKTTANIVTELLVCVFCVLGGSSQLVIDNPHERPFGRSPTTLLRDLLTMVANRLLIGMILQVG